MMLDMSCERCGGHGLPGYKHNQAGKCFVCGALPVGEKVESDVGRVSARERAICDFMTLLARARSEIAEGDVMAWWEDVLPDVRARIGVAPRDVATRATAAFARLGLSV